MLAFKLLGILALVNVLLNYIHVHVHVHNVFESNLHVPLFYLLLLLLLLFYVLSS